MTLAFLGEVDPEKSLELKNLRIKGEKHTLPIEQARFWPHNRIIWLGPNEVPDSLGFLSKGLVEILGTKGFRTEKRPFAAHITLVRKARDPGPLPAVPAVDWPVEEIVLVRSQLSAEGSRYEVLQRYPLS